VRILLAAITCAKGDPEANLDAHLDVVAEGHRAGADLVVFPEMSLTGSVDPTRTPERAIPLDHPIVERLVTATGRYQVAVLFGIAESDDRTCWITQVEADAGRIQGIQRKRHLGEDEAGFSTSGDTTVFELGTARFASIICAESSVDRTWDANATAGATLHLLSAAPGLYERRTDADAWRAGLEWWETAGLADARHQARRLGAWVGVATQAGSTVDEDFPGLAAMVSPDGEVVARLPDTRPGTLLVDVPIPVEVPPGAGRDPDGDLGR
jgi:predicted amidohydrolase